MIKKEKNMSLKDKAVLMNGMSIFASYGALVLIFQQGYFQDVLGFTADAIEVITWLSIFIFLSFI